MKKTKLHKGRLCISRSSTGLISIHLEDDKSRTECVEIVCTPKDFAVALMHGTSPVRFKWSPKNVGKKHEHKTEDVAMTLYSTFSREQQKAAVEEAITPYEVDGWMGNRSDLENHHRLVKGPNGPRYRVTFHRFV